MNLFLTQIPATPTIETIIRITYNCKSVLSPVFGDDCVALSIVLVSCVILVVSSEGSCVVLVVSSSEGSCVVPVVSSEGSCVPVVFSFTVK